MRESERWRHSERERECERVGVPRVHAVEVFGFARPVLVVPPVRLFLHIHLALELHLPLLQPTAPPLTPSDPRELKAVPCTALRTSANQGREGG